MVLIIIFILLFSITIHEYAHGWTAYKLGDPTPLISKRLTLNPFAHIDMMGMFFLPLFLLIVTRGRFTFGYAKPVPINPYNFKKPKRDIMWVGLAGPLSNFLLAFFLIQILKIGLLSFLEEAITYGILLNLVLCVFNLLPIPPLDGSRVLVTFLPSRLAYRYLKLEVIGLFLILLLIQGGLINWFVIPIIRSFISWLGIGGIEF